MQFVFFTTADKTAISSQAKRSVQTTETYTGSVSCRECHEKFYKLWAPSHHGKAMQPFTPNDLAAYQVALMEHKNSFLIWPDRWISHYNLGLFYDREGDQTKALASFKKASDLRPDVIQPLVNASMLHARMNNTDKSKELLKKALGIEPTAPSVNFNMALLEAESNNLPAAEKYFRAALPQNPAWHKRHITSASS